MKARIETLKAEVLELQKKGIQYNILKREAETNRSLYNSLLQRYKEVDIAGGVGTNNVFVVDRASVPISPSEPNVPRSLMLSLVLGLGAGAALALFLELLDDRVRAPEEIEQLSGLSTLGVIPRIESQELFAEAIADPRSPVAEAYRSLATALQFSTDSGLPRSISVTSAGGGEGKSTTVIAIARHFAQMGTQGAFDRCRSAEALTAYKAQIKQCDWPQQLFDRPVPSPRAYPENRPSKSCFHGLWAVATQCCGFAKRNPDSFLDFTWL